MFDGERVEPRTGAVSGERIEPPEAFKSQATVADTRVAETFSAPDDWTDAGELLRWEQPYETVFDGTHWFPDGTLNASVNCVDRHLDTRKNQQALIWEGQVGTQRSYTYLELFREINEMAAALRSIGVSEGDVVTIHMPVIPELPIVMFACARIGAPHAVVFAGFSAEALKTRLAESESEFLVTCDGYYRRGDAVSLKNKADTVRAGLDQEITTVVVDHLAGYEYALGRNEHRYDDLRETHAGERVEPVARDAADDLFLIYTSGTTGDPKRVTHTTGGYLAQVAWTARAVLDIKPEDTYWCTADLGWITGHSYVVYGPLALGTTVLLADSELAHQPRDEPWRRIERYAVDIFYTSPTNIRTFMSWGESYPASHDLSSLRLLGTVGEPINPRAWQWFYEYVGGGKCPIVDTWWQTETGAHLLTTIPGVEPMKPGTAGPALPGIDAAVVDNEGTPVEPGIGGYLVIDSPWPAMARELAERTGWGTTVTSERGGADGTENGWRYWTGDGAVMDEDGYITIVGRVDDVINVSGHRFGTAELESVIVSVPGVSEAAVVVGSRDDTDHGIYAYVQADEHRDREQLREEILAAVEDAVGAFARPSQIVFAPDLPKTSSGKIIRRLLTDIAQGEEIEELSALRNPEIVGLLESELQSD